MIIYKTKEEIERMRESGRLTALVLEKLKEAVAPGVTPLELDTLAYEIIRKNGGRPAFKGYRGFPNTITASINEEVVHAIPRKRRLKEGDIISIDVGVVLGGYYGDAAITVPVGKVSQLARRLIEVTERALYIGIEKARVGNRIGDISNAIERFVEGEGFSVVRDFTGHGIGTKLHEDPQVPHYGPPGRGPRIKPGLVIAIEPMINAGGYEVEILPDGWTVVTKDRSLSAQFEHTVAITEEGPEILTRP
ncbi:MAG: type I methionyl aminopeptidase [Acidobacteria bacterium]|nr:type I methionyl aminopeptidase [Acidobacteriota bacterium]